MNIALVLSGGIGSRMGADIPKQYILVDGKPILFYSLQMLQNHKAIDAVVLVASDEWKQFIEEWIETLSIDKVIAIVPGGESRQHSVLNGLNYIKEQCVDMNIKVLIHDAARPGVKASLIDMLLAGINEADAVVPIIPVKDTMYFSSQGLFVEGLVDRSTVYAAQSPEALDFEKYYMINAGMSDEELLMTRGCSESAFNHGLKVKMIPGDEKNYKITTREDLDRFVAELSLKCLGQNN